MFTDSNSKENYPNKNSKKREIDNQISASNTSNKTSEKQQNQNKRQCQNNNKNNQSEIPKSNSQIIISNNGTWERQKKAKETFYSSVSFFSGKKQYLKLNRKGNKATKGDHKKNIYIKTNNILKRFEHISDNGNERTSILIKTIEVLESDFPSTIKRAKKLMEVGEALDYLIRRKENSIKIDVIMPFYEGEDLLKYFHSYHDNSDRLTQNETLALISIILSALCTVNNFHNTGHTHFDIKPENLFLDKQKRQVRLLDAEFAWSEAELQQASQDFADNKPIYQKSGHTKLYAAPEFLNPNHYISSSNTPNNINKYLLRGKHCDYYSMGLVLKFILGIYSGKGKKIDYNNVDIQSRLSRLLLNEEEKTNIITLINSMLDKNITSRASIDDAFKTFEPIYCRLSNDAKLKYVNDDVASKDTCSQLKL